MDDIKIEYDLHTIDSNDEEDGSSVICLSDVFSDIEGDEDEEDRSNYNDIEIVSVGSEPFVKEEANQGSESRCRSCGTCLRKEIADTGTQTEESFFQDKSKDQQSENTQSNGNTQNSEVASASTSGNRVSPEKRTSTNYDSSRKESSTDKNKTNSGGERIPVWRSIRPYRNNSNEHRSRPYNNSVNNRHHHRYQMNRSDLNNFAMRQNNFNHRDMPLPYNNPNGALDVQNYYKNRIYNGFINFANYVFQEDFQNDRQNHYNNGSYNKK